MAVVIKIEITCDGCTHPYEHAQFDSVSIAHATAAQDGWKLVRIFNRELDFCPVCQEASMKASA